MRGVKASLYSWVIRAPHQMTIGTRDGITVRIAARSSSGQPATGPSGVADQSTAPCAAWVRPSCSNRIRPESSAMSAPAIGRLDRGVEAHGKPGEVCVPNVEWWYHGSYEFGAGFDQQPTLHRRERAHRRLP